MDIQKSNFGWSDQELEVSVNAYLKMLALEKSGETFSKSAINRLLKEGPLKLRSAASIDYRMRNISSVLEQLGLDRIISYSAAQNIGAGVRERISETILRLIRLKTSAFEPWQSKDQSDSLLYQYLTSHTPQAIKISEEVLYSAITNSSAQAFEDKPHTKLTIPELEEEIVELLKRKGEITELSIDAHKHLLYFLTPSWDKLQKFLNLVAAITLIVNLYNLIENPRSSKNLRSSVDSYEPEMKELFSGSSVVSGNDVIVRLKPDKLSEKLGRLSRGALVENLEGDTSGWIRIEADVGGKKVKGWIYKNYLIKL
ncbi:SH3 domain-containing protein [Pseudomonas fluorescens]|uniref:SH3 domain-containing protein n=1 Tax=Pseudomonas fluorescens TaxID=294 RepID=UPI00177F2F97|nr:SH3 domain-containing protein [Pseudomonas fluorescens]MBD8147458.1 SH3 domain-containing protein [Pseudomonas fluorescens]MBD8176975.1 SH3 domain-containing protein [Pseudomonas fluorescens]MBD8746633.1 SH3 domain-containing protein [Pseudomonas fluorescens]MBD8751059.1 SH3 domain-containing protein [Pseudomonas fluorescens]MBD8760098.1 SH3 domain-containing protein [Pseudomonas fluorescens]